MKHISWRWLGRLDPTLDCLPAKGTFPLPRSPVPSSAAPISGSHEAVMMSPSIMKCLRNASSTVAVQDGLTKTPIGRRSFAAGDVVDQQLKEGDVRLTVGGEPTFLASRDPDADEWNTAALGPTKASLGDRLLRRLLPAWVRVR